MYFRNLLNNSGLSFPEYLTHIFKSLSAQDRQALLDCLLRLNSSLREQAKQCKTEAHQHQSA